MALLGEVHKHFRDKSLVTENVGKNDGIMSTNILNKLLIEGRFFSNMYVLKSLTKKSF